MQVLLKRGHHAARIGNKGRGDLCCYLFRNDDFRPREDIVSIEALKFYHEQHPGQHFATMPLDELKFDAML